MPVASPQFTLAHPDLQRDALVRINIEYVSWVVSEEPRAFWDKLSASLSRCASQAPATPHAATSDRSPPADLDLPFVRRPQRLRRGPDGRFRWTLLVSRLPLQRQGAGACSGCAAQPQLHLRGVCRGTAFIVAATRCRRRLKGGAGRWATKTAGWSDCPGFALRSPRSRARCAGDHADLRVRKKVFAYS